MPDRTTPYLIWSHEHRGWWRGNRTGYSANLWDAGLYDAAEAQEICEQASIGWHAGLPPEVIVPLPENFARRGVDDVVAELRASIDAATKTATESRAQGDDDA